jgi:hypothetical protein
MIYSQRTTLFTRLHNSLSFGKFNETLKTSEVVNTMSISMSLASSNFMRHNLIVDSRCISSLYSERHGCFLQSQSYYKKVCITVFGSMEFHIELLHAIVDHLHLVITPHPSSHQSDQKHKNKTKFE